MLAVESRQARADRLHGLHVIDWSLMKARVRPSAKLRPGAGSSRRFVEPVIG
jgi:hypothetical protein